MVHGDHSISAWEYLILAEAERDRLGELGREGWELVAIGGDGHDRLLYLKRPRQSFRERVTLDQRAVYFAALGLDGEAPPRSGA